MYAGSRDRAQRVEPASRRRAGRASRRPTAARATARRAERASPCRRGGESRTRSPCSGTPIVCAHSLYGQDDARSSASGRTRPAASAGTTSAAARGRSSRRCLSVAYVLTLFAFQSARASVVTAQQPTLDLRSARPTASRRRPRRRRPRPRRAACGARYRRATSRYAPTHEAAVPRAGRCRGCARPSTAPSGSARRQPKRSAACRASGRRSPPRGSGRGSRGSCARRARRGTGAARPRGPASSPIVGVSQRRPICQTIERRRRRRRRSARARRPPSGGRRSSRAGSRNQP